MVIVIFSNRSFLSTNNIMHKVDCRVFLSKSSLSSLYLRRRHLPRGISNTSAIVEIPLLAPSRTILQFPSSRTFFHDVD